MSDTKNFSVTNTTRTNPPRVSFCEIKEKILGKKYDLSLVFVGDKKSRTLNKKYRGKDKPANCLSFSLSPNSGEIFLNMKKAKKEAILLFIHSCLHLKGMEHGDRMEKAETKFLKKF